MMNGGMMFSKGDIVIVKFPFSNLVQFKKRPMLVLGEKDQDIIGCVITSNPESEGVLIESFQQGTLPFKSKVKYWQIHTILKEVIERKVAKVSSKTHKEVVKKIHELMNV